MSSYEVVKEAFAGTDLAEHLPQIALDLRLTPDSPEWIICALGILANEPVKAERLKMEELASQIPEAVRAEVRKVLEGDLSAQIREAIVDEAGPLIVESIEQRLKKTVQATAETLDQTHADHREKMGKILMTHASATSQTIDAFTKIVHDIRDAQVWTFFIAGVMVLVTFALSIGGTMWLEYKAPNGAYHAGYVAGASVERNALRKH